MGRIRNFFKRVLRRAEKDRELRTIINKYYGGNVSWFAYNYASNIYNIPEVRTAIETFAQIFVSIPKYFERKDKDGHIVYFENASSRVLTLKSNPLQNAAQFWSNFITQLLVNSNVFAEPVFDGKTGDLKQIYVLPNDQFAFKLYDDRATVEFMSIGKTYDVGNLIYVNRFSTLGGGTRNELGLYETVIQALAAQAINVADPKKPHAILQSNAGAQGNLKPQDKKGTMDDIKVNFDNTVKGIVYFDPQWKITPINWQENDVNRELMQFAINVVYNYFGITDAIINNKATEIEYEMFIKNKIEPIARQVEQEFTAKLFTKREQEFGNRFELDTFNLSISTLSAKTALFSVAARQGVMNLDEMREIIGLPPIPGGYGQMYRVTADTVNIEKADEYQLTKNGIAEAAGTAEEPKDPAAAGPKGGNHAEE